MPVDMGKSDGHSGKCFPQVFQAIGRGQGLLDLGSADGGVQVGGSLREDHAVVRCQDPHMITDELFGFLHQVLDLRSHAHVQKLMSQLVTSMSDTHRPGGE
jgi:hypothetical protein